MNGEQHHLEPRVSSLETAMRGVADDLKVVSTTLTTLSEKLDTKTAPNFQTLISLAAVILTIIGAVAAPCAWFVVHEMARQDTNLRDMDTKLQNEYRLMDNTSAARHADAVSRVEKLERWRDEQIKSDLEELRQRRMAGK